jgi:hypothetical protein
MGVRIFNSYGNMEVFVPRGKMDFAKTHEVEDLVKFKAIR